MGMFSDDIRKIETQITEWVSKGLDILQQEIDKRTPEDTKTLLSNNKKIWPVKTLTTIGWSIENDTEYAFFVEFWVRNRVYNYHKPKWTVFYQWVGARMFTRARDDNETRIRNIINEALS